MTIMELGALGEILGAIAVIVTLIYLAVQIKQNTRSMTENRQLALAQTYQMRADALQGMRVRRLAPVWQELGLLGGRPSFRREVESILSDDEA